MEWSRPIDAYCERLGPGFWAEPWNALTNGAFVLAALLALGMAARRGRLEGPVAALGLTVVAVGVGSFLFHTVATRWAAVADTVPILLFILGYLGTALVRFCGLGLGWAALGVAGFLGGSAVIGPVAARVVGGSAGYLPALVALVAVGGWLTWRRHPAARGLMAAAGLFAVSLSLRAVDQPLCGRWPLGTHFAWHLANAAVLGLLLVTLIRHGAPRR